MSCGNPYKLFEAPSQRMSCGNPYNLFEVPPSENELW